LSLAITGADAVVGHEVSASGRRTDAGFESESQRDWDSDQHDYCSGELKIGLERNEEISSLPSESYIQAQEVILSVCQNRVDFLSKERLQ
jgi:hypothetical protein